MLAAEERGAVIDRLPHLVGGVLLNNAADAARARVELTAARLLPCAAVAVGTTAAVGSNVDAPGVELVVPPNPAMVDEEAAAQVRAELSDATRARSAALERLTSALDRDRELLARVQGVAGPAPDARRAGRCRRCGGCPSCGRPPPGPRPPTAEVADLDARAEALEADRPRLVAAAAATRERAAALVGLAAETERAPALRERARAGAADAARAESQAGAARAEGDQAREDADAARRRQDRHTGVVERARAELAELPLDTADPVVSSGDAFHSRGSEAGPPVPLGVLRGAYTQACAAYAAAEVGADLSAQLGGAERDARTAQAFVDALAPGARAAAEALLHSPDAADPAARRAAADQARRDLARAADRRQQTATATALARKELAGFTATSRTVAPYGEPTSPEDGQERVERAEQDRRAAEDVVTRAARRARDAERERAAVAASAEGFGHVVRGLDGAIVRDGTDGDADDVVPFAGDVTAAVEAMAAARAALADTAGERTRAEREVRSAVDAVAQFAQEPRFGTLTSPVRRHISGIARTEMPALAGEWRALRPRAAFARGRPREHRPPPRGHRHAPRRHGRPGAADAPARAAALRAARRPRRLVRPAVPARPVRRHGRGALRHALGEVVDRTAEQQVAGNKRPRRPGGATA